MAFLRFSVGVAVGSAVERSVGKGVFIMEFVGKIIHYTPINNRIFIAVTIALQLVEISAKCLNSFSFQLSEIRTLDKGKLTCLSGEEIKKTLYPLRSGASGYQNFILTCPTDFSIVI